MGVVANKSTSDIANRTVIWKGFTPTEHMTWKGGVEWVFLWDLRFLLNLMFCSSGDIFQDSAYFHKLLLHAAQCFCVQAHPCKFLRRFRHTWVLVLHSVFFPTWIMNMVSFSTFSARSKAWLKISSVSYPSILTTANFTRIEASTLTSVKSTHISKHQHSSLSKRLLKGFSKNVICYVF